LPEATPCGCARWYLMNAKVLIVEDEFLVRSVAVEALTVAGFEVLEAGDGYEAVAYCAEHDLDLLFTDIQLPGEIDGWEIAKRCRQSQPMLPVVYATALARDESRAVPGSVLFRKPYTPDQLIGIVQTLTREG
jgi:CheY-like chemotaxis protein